MTTLQPQKHDQKALVHCTEAVRDAPRRGAARRAGTHPLDANFDAVSMQHMSLHLTSGFPKGHTSPH